MGVIGRARHRKLFSMLLRRHHNLHLLHASNHRRHGSRLCRACDLPVLIKLVLSEAVLLSYTVPSSAACVLCKRHRQFRPL